MARCVSCGSDVPDDARFCSSCGAAQQTQSHDRERRVVSILFADLVGFTERSERADPEDVRRILVPFHAAAKAEIERFGGTLDKFIGDAAMGVFGAPIAHEDDPERAVRAALSLQARMAEQQASDPELAIRVAVHTGEALVSLAGGMQVGEAVAGDVVNTASRMQSVASPGEVVIGASTRRELVDRFQIDELPEVAVKGKARPLRLWRVVAERERHHVAVAAPFVNRDAERTGLARAMDRLVEAGGAAPIVLVGDPGIGKSRLLAELRDSTPSNVRWRLGRCEPYGEGLTFGAVAEILRQELGDGSGGDLLSRLENAARSRDVDPGWMVSRLGPMLGVEGGSSDPVSLSEIARACAAALTARPEPLVMVIEDLHWAQPALTEVVALLLEELLEQPALAIVTGRPELLDTDERWRSRGDLIELSPLSRADTDRLVGSVLTSEDRAWDRSGLLERSSGNPLFAIEFARMVDEDRAEQVGDVPSSVRAVIAARLDRLPHALRTSLQRASVVGPEFWPGAVAASASVSEEEVRERLGQLADRGLVEPIATSPFDGQDAFAFTHDLIREVAYAQLTREVRSRAHLEVTRWIERTAGLEANQFAGSLAFHAREALDLAEAAGLEDVLVEAREPALEWLLEAAGQVSRIDAIPAFEHYERVRSLAAPGSAELAQALAGSAFTGRRSGRLDAREVLRRHEESVALQRLLDNPEALGRSLVALGSQLAAVGQVSRSREVLHEAVKVLEAHPGIDLGRAYAFLAEEAMFAGKVHPAIRGADRALELVGDRAPDIEVMALHIRGDGRCSLGDERGLADLRRALDVSIRVGSVADQVTSETYLAEWLWAYQGSQEGVAHYERAIALADRHGVVSQLLYSIAGSTGALFDHGGWDLALARCEELLSLEPERIDASLRVVATVVRARISLLRGKRASADDPEELVRLAEPLGELHVFAPALLVAGQLSLADGEREVARGHVHRFAEVTREVAETYRESLLAPLSRLAVELGEVDLADELVRVSGGRTPRERLNVRAAGAVVAEARSSLDAALQAYDEVVDEWRSYGHPFEQAMALLGRARCREALGEADHSSVAAAHQILSELGVPV